MCKIAFSNAIEGEEEKELKALTTMREDKFANGRGMESLKIYGSFFKKKDRKLQKTKKAQKLKKKLKELKKNLNKSLKY